MQLPNFEKSYMPTLVNGSDVNMADAKMVEKADVATTVANKDTWHATVQKVDRHPEDENAGNHGRTRRNETKVEMKPDRVVRSRGRSGMGSNIAWHRRHNDSVD